MSAISPRMPKLKAIAPVGTSRQMGEISPLCGSCFLWTKFVFVSRLNYRSNFNECLILDATNSCLAITYTNVMVINAIKCLNRRGDIAFLRWRPSAILDLFHAFGPPMKHTRCCLYRYAKFGWNRHCSFEDMRFSIFCSLGLKMPIHALLGRFLGKNKKNGNFLQFYPSRNAITCD